MKRDRNGVSDFGRADSNNDQRRKIMKNIITVLVWTALAAVISTACGGGKDFSTIYPPTKDGAKSLLEEFLKPGADCKKMTTDLRPTKEDYRAFYGDEATAARAETFFTPLWTGGSAVVAPKEGQTELKLFSATTQELKDMSGDYANFPTGMAALADDLKPNLTIYAFKFVKPGETTGMAFEGLTNVNGHWRLFPKPWKFLESK